MKYKVTINPNTKLQQKDLQKIQHSYLKQIESDRESPNISFSLRQQELSSLRLIAQGHPEEIEAALFSKDSSFTMHIGKTSENPVHQARYIFVSTITLCTRTAIDNGLPEMIAFDMSDEYIKRVDIMTDIDQIYVLSLHAMKDFAQAVKDWRFPDVSPHIRSCLEYITSHFYYNITLQDLAKACNLSPNYVSSSFKKEMGLSAMQCVKMMKLEHAKYLLTHEKKGVSQIAQLLAFPSHSSFCEAFRKRFGCTPSVYRQENC